ncbi:MAG: DUF2892 domain-containing protein [Deltaproteobacteria bacterium]|nr:DUF2892 domain-containing protein [Deltaproteobacteria bacterium]
MSKNVGRTDRIVRLLGAAVMLACSIMAPLPLVLRAGAFGVTGVYLLFTAVVGTCVGYTLMGRSTCPNQSRP